MLFAGTIGSMICPVDGPTEERHKKIRRKTRRGQRHSAKKQNQQSSYVQLVSQGPTDEHKRPKGEQRRRRAETKAKNKTGTWYLVYNSEQVLLSKGLLGAWRIFTYSRALLSCCAVARAQLLGQNSRFAQKPPRGWVRAARHAFFWRATFFAAGKTNCYALFFAGGDFLS